MISHIEKLVKGKWIGIRQKKNDEVQMVLSQRTQHPYFGNPILVLSSSYPFVLGKIFIPGDFGFQKITVQVDPEFYDFYYINQEYLREYFKSHNLRFKQNKLVYRQQKLSLGHFGMALIENDSEND